MSSHEDARRITPKSVCGNGSHHVFKPGTRVLILVSTSSRSPMTPVEEVSAMAT